MGRVVGHRERATAAAREVRLRFTENALRDMSRLHAFVSEHDPAAADRVRDRLLESLNTLATQPLSGRPVEDVPVREWIANGYVVRYIARAGEVIIVRIWHGREFR